MKNLISVMARYGLGLCVIAILLSQSHTAQAGAHHLDRATEARVSAPVHLGTLPHFSIVPNLPNSEQIAVQPGDVIINEIMKNPSAVADSVGEWFELYNTTNSDINIDGWTIRDLGFDTHTIDNGGSLLIPAHGYLVLGASADTIANGETPLQYAYGVNWALANWGDEIVLLDENGNEINRVAYNDSDFPNPDGASLALIDANLNNSVGAHWCEATTPYGFGDLGTPGAANDCPDAAAVPPQVLGTTPADRAYDVPPHTQIEITFNKRVNVQDGWFEISCAENGTVAATVSGGPYAYTLVPADEFTQNDHCEVTIHAASVTDRGNASDTLAVDYTFQFAFESPPAACGQPATLIHQIQGDGATFDMTYGGLQTIEGIVTGDFPGLKGFYVQEEPGDADGMPTTSEGIFVFLGDGYDAAPVSRGNQVRVTGEVGEYITADGISQQTQISGTVEVVNCGAADVSIQPVDITLPMATPDAFERYEGMLVRIPDALVISDYFNFDRFGEITLARPREDQPRLYQPTALVPPGDAAAEIAQQNALRQITLDDGRNTQNPDPARHPNGVSFGLHNRFRGGDSVTNVVGVVDHTFGRYRIQPTQGATVITTNPRPQAPADVGGTIRVASFNLSNYFVTLDDGQPSCGPELDQECRGADADQPAEFERQSAKLLATLAALNADLYGLVELENTAGVEPLQSLVDGLNALNGPGAPPYAFVDTGTIGPDAIRVGIIYRPATVVPHGNFAVLDSAAFLDPNGTGEAQNRPALAQSFRTTANGGIFTLVVNHFKSKGSSCGLVDDDAQDDTSQGDCNETRTLAARTLADWLATDPTGADDADVLILGDLNAYAQEDPIAALRAGADDTAGNGDDYVNLVAQFQGEFAYSYLFDGQLGYLDHALASQSLAEQVTGLSVWHINADEPDILDYDTSFKQPAQDELYEPNPFRSSDHDPILVGIAPTPDTTTQINRMLTMEQIKSSYSPVPIPYAPAGVFTIRATYRNRGDSNISDIYFHVVELSGGNLLLNADGEPGGTGATLTVLPSALGEDGTLTTGETFQVTFKIGMQSHSSFDFFVDAYGSVGLLGAGAAGQGTVDDGAFHLPVDAQLLEQPTIPAALDRRLYLPTLPQ